MKNLTTHKKVSLVVPTYNQAPYLGACLDAIWFQDYPNLEIIVVDDASTDETREILDRFVNEVANEMVSYASFYNAETDEIERTRHRRYPRHGRQLKILRNERNLGSTRTYNRGFKACTGDYCTYIASDDICHPAMISSMVEVLDSGEADFVYSDMFVINDEGRILREFRQPEYNFEECFCNWYLIGVSKLYPLALHERLGYYNNDYLANDVECYLRFALNGVRFKRIPKVLYSVRCHEQRQVGVHSPGNWNRLLDECRQLVKKARACKLNGKGSN